MRLATESFSCPGKYGQGTFLVVRREGKMLLDLIREKKVINASGSQGRQTGTQIVDGSLPLREIRDSNPPQGECLSCAPHATAKGRRAGKGWRGLAGSSLRASDNYLDTILVEGLNGGRFFKMDRPSHFAGHDRPKVCGSKRRTWPIFLILFLTLLSSSPSAAISVSREEALAGFDSSRKRILANVDANPTEAADDLIILVVRPIRYHTKVMDLCDELVAKSTTTAGIEMVLSALNKIAATSAEDLRQHGEVIRVRRIVDRALRTNDLLVQLMAARVLESLGPDVAAQRVAAYEKIFSASPAQIDNGLREFSAEDLRYEMVGIVRKLLPQVKKDRRIRSIVKQATEKYNLLAFFGSHIESSRQPGTIDERHRIFKDWQNLMMQK